MSSFLQKVLLVQGQSKQLQDVAETLKSSDFDIAFIDPKDSLTKIDEIHPDLIFLQYSISDMSGILFCKSVIENPTYALVPIVFISNSQLREHRLHAFELGAVGYITRPISKIELTNAAKSYTKGRKHIREDRCILIGNLFLNPTLKKVFINDKEVALTAIEFKLLHFLLADKKQIIPKSEIYEHLWGKDVSKTGRLDTQLYNLKKKIYNFNGAIKSVSKIGLRIIVENATCDQVPKTGARALSSEEPRP